MAVKNVVKPIEDLDSDLKDQKVLSYWKISSNDFLYLLTEVSLILYPGSFAVVTEKEFDSVSEAAKKMINSEEITEAEFKKYRKTQGLLGAVK